MSDPTTRASVFPDNDLDVSDFAPAPPPKASAPPDEVRAVSENAQFRSREPRSSLASARRPRRTYRTGRNIQLNIKVRSEAMELFYQIADRQGWVLGDAFERAVQALSRSLASD